jgi:hypothetical protein
MLFNSEDTYNPDSLHKVQDFAERALEQLNTGDIIQFERFGFVRIEHTPAGIIANFCHR